jgi:molybdopterin biosynthesis enzyme MoaB
LKVLDRLTPGIDEALRARSLEITPYAMLSRGVSGIRHESLIINLPGSPKAVEEQMTVLVPVLPHAIQMIKGIDTDRHDLPHETGVERNNSNEEKS